MSECRVCESTPKVQPVYHQSAGPFAQVAQFSFTLPPAEQMGELLPWMQAAMHMVDQLGSYKLKPDQKVRLSLDQTFLQMASGPLIIGYLMRINAVLHVCGEFLWALHAAGCRIQPFLSAASQSGRHTLAG